MEDTSQTRTHLELQGTTHLRLVSGRQLNRVGTTALSPAVHGQFNKDGANVCRDCKEKPWYHNKQSGCKGLDDRHTWFKLGWG